MKSLFNKIFILGICSLVFCSCEKDEDQVIVKTGASPVLSTSASSIVLSTSDADKEAVKVSWTPAEYGFDAGVKYVLQFDKKGNNFAKPVTIIYDSMHNIPLKGGELNWIALRAGLAKGVAGELEIRVRSGISAKVDSLHSNTTTISVTPFIAASTLSASTTSTTFVKENANKNFITLMGTAADFGSPNAVIKYYLEFDKKGSNFSNATRVAFPSPFNKPFLVKEVNQIAKKLGMFVGSPAELEVRIKSSVSTKIDSTSSNVLTYTITPYPAADLTEYPVIYMVGDATEFGWVHTKATPMFRSEANKYLHTFTGYFKKGELKFIKDLGQWVPMWGSSGGTGVAFRETLDDAEPISFMILENGYYKVTLDIELLKFTAVDYNATTAPTYSSIGMTGNFDSWGYETMTTSTFNPHIWKLDYTLTTPSSPETGWQLKFRAENAWTIKFTAERNWSGLYGILDGTADGNLYIAPGSYTFLFNDLTKEYHFISK